jgi:hypothetical protein
MVLEFTLVMITPTMFPSRSHPQTNIRGNLFHNQLTTVKPLFVRHGGLIFNLFFEKNFSLKILTDFKFYVKRGGAQIEVLP